MVYEIGTDLKSTWTFKNGDLTTVTDDENLKQSIYNRITTPDGTYRHFYTNYGSVLEPYLGYQKTQTTLEFLKIELERVLLQDPRLQDFKINLEYHEQGVKVDLRVNINGTNTTLNFITNGTKIIEENE